MTSHVGLFFSPGAGADAAGGDADDDDDDDDDASEEVDSTVERMAVEITLFLLDVVCDGEVKARAPVMAERRGKTVVVLMIGFEGTIDEG